MKRFICILIALMLLLSGCGFDVLLEQFTVEPDLNVVQYRELRYFAQEMDEESYANMCVYYEAAMDFEKWCDLPHPMEQEELEQLLTVIRYECPELMMLDVTREFTLYATGGQVTRVELPYAMTRQEYEDKLEQTRSVIGELVDQCAGLSQAEQEKLIYDYIVTNCIYDETTQWGGTAYGCLVEGVAKCDGISFAMKWIMEELGISCMIIAGDPPSGGVGHAWNVIQIDGSWYDLDVTADVSREQGNAACYPAYNVSDSWIRELYTLGDAYDTYGRIPGAADMTGSYHGVTGCYVEAGGGDRLEELYAEAYENGGTFTLQFEDQKDFEELEETLEARLEELGNQKGWRTWSWSTLSVPDYRTISITAGT